MTPTAPSRFGPLNHVVDDGWLAELTPLELRVWLVYFRHAGHRGRSPSNTEIGRAVGHENGHHISAARKRLAERGLIRFETSAGGSRTSTTEVMMLVAQPPSKSEGGIKRETPVDTGPPSKTDPRPLPMVTPLESGSSVYIEKQTKEQTKGAHGAKRKKKARFDPASAPIPASLDTPEFRAAFLKWIHHRETIGHPLTEDAVQLQFAKLAPLGPVVGINAINRSRESGWTGLFPDKASGNGHAPAPQVIHATIIHRD